MNKKYILVQEALATTATIFFLPLSTRPKHYPPIDMKGEYWHTGIIYKNKVYETFNNAKYRVSNLSSIKKDLDKQKAAYLTNIPIDPTKLSSELKSGTSCDEYVLRVTNKSNTKGKDKGKHNPTDVYRMLMI